MKTKTVSLFLFILFTMVSVTSYCQTVVATSLQIVDPALGGNSDGVSLHRADVIQDRARVRLSVGDEYTSDFELGYYYYGDGQWTSNFTVDGYGNSYTRGNVGIGTRNLTERLNVDGRILAEEVKVVVDVPADFVFEADYKRTPLDSLSKFVSEHKHLPNIPSAAEIKRDGWAVGEMSNLLLQKVEELTLYIIEQNRKIMELEKEVKHLSTESLKKCKK